MFAGPGHNISTDHPIDGTCDINTSTIAIQHNSLG
jgi:hypothetical protein